MRPEPSGSLLGKGSMERQGRALVASRTASSTPTPCCFHVDHMSLRLDDCSQVRDCWFPSTRGTPCGGKALFLFRSGLEKRTLRGFCENKGRSAVMVFAVQLSWWRWVLEACNTGNSLTVGWNSDGSSTAAGGAGLRAGHRSRFGGAGGLPIPAKSSTVVMIGHGILDFLHQERAGHLDGSFSPARRGPSALTNFFAFLVVGPCSTVGPINFRSSFFPSRAQWSRAQQLPHGCQANEAQSRQRRRQCCHRG